ncbi:MAG: flagellar basal body-associated FliL family protein [Brevinematales bacterium]|nr:flagellar basal body-associated FliL family protein [Brevinematales bacterium]
MGNRNIKISWGIIPAMVMGIVLAVWGIPALINRLTIGALTQKVLDKNTPPDSSVPLKTYQLPVIRTELPSGTGKAYVEAGIGLGYPDKPGLEDEIRQNIPLLKSLAIEVLATFNTGQIDDPTGREALALELAHRFNKALTKGTVEEIFFYSFLITDLDQIGGTGNKLQPDELSNKIQSIQHETLPGMEGGE